MGIPRIYRGLPEQNLASYDFYDLATGTGYKNFYGCDLITGTNTTTKILTSQTIYAYLGYSNYYDESVDLDLDLALNTPLTIQGDCAFCIPMGTAGNMTSKTFTIKFYKVSASNVETQIGTAVTIDKALNNTITILCGKYTLPITRLKAGEKLRFNVTSTSVGLLTLQILHDPKNRTLGTPTNTITSQLIVNLPIKL